MFRVGAIAEHVMPFSGSFVGFTFQLEAGTINDISVTAEIRVNGDPVGVAISIDENSPRFNYITLDPGLATFKAGDIITSWLDFHGFQDVQDEM